MHSAMFAAATTTLRKFTNIRTAAYHVLLATMVGPCAVLVAFWYYPAMARWWGLIISVAVGLTIFAWAVVLEKVNKRIEDVDPASLLHQKLSGTLPPATPGEKEMKP